MGGNRVFPIMDSYSGLVEHFDIGRAGADGSTPPCRVYGQHYLALPARGRQVRPPSVTDLKDCSVTSILTTPSIPQLPGGQLGFWAPCRTFRLDVWTDKIIVRTFEPTYGIVDSGPPDVPFVILHMDKQKTLENLTDVISLALAPSKNSLEALVYGLAVHTEDGVSERLGVIEFFHATQEWMGISENPKEGSGHEWRYICLK